MLYDCQLGGNYPLVRLPADDAESAKAEYFRRYRIYESRADWTCRASSPDSPSPIEPEAWLLRRKQLNTLDATELKATADKAAPPKIEPDKAEQSKAPEPPPVKAK